MRKFSLTSDLNKKSFSLEHGHDWDMGDFQIEKKSLNTTHK